MRILLSVGIIAYCATSLNGGCANSKGNFLEPIVRAEADFASNIFKAVVNQQFQNTLCSPISAELTLSIMKHGALGNTLRELESVLQNSDAGSSTIKFLNDINKYPRTDLNIVNDIFVRQGLSLNVHFKESIVRVFKSSIENIDFGNATTASNRINEWSAAHTNNITEHIIDPTSIHPDSQLILANALYFNGAWAEPFDPVMTEPCPFYVNGKTIKQVPTMSNVGAYPHGNLAKFNATFIKMPYWFQDFDHDLGMYVIIPDDVDGFIELGTKLDEITIDMFRYNELNDTNIEIKMPKFMIDTLLDLSGSLEQLGLNDMFSDDADFTGMWDDDNLSVKAIIQSAFFEVNEDGTEYTVLQGQAKEKKTSGKIRVVGNQPSDNYEKEGLMNRSGEPERPPQYIVDRPFFTIIATETGVVLLSALIVDPLIE